MASDAVEPSYHPEGSSPEAVLQFLSQHRQGAERDREPRNRRGRRRPKTALLGVVVAIALVGAGVLIWRNVASDGGAGTAAPRTNAPRASKGASGSSAGGKTQKAATHRPAAEPWHRSLQSWREPTAGRRLPSFYYRWIRAGSTCASYATYGCWKVKVVARHGCPQGVTMLVEETQGGAVVGAAWGFSKRLAPRTPRIVEVDADQSGVSGRLKSMDCKS